MKQNKYFTSEVTHCTDIFSSLKTESCEWLSTREAAEHLRICEYTLRNIVSMGKIPYYKFGRRLRFLKSELNQYLLMNRKGGL